MNITDQQKQNALNAGKNAIKTAYNNPKSKTLTWWERLIWIILAGLLACANSITTGCSDMKDITITTDKGTISITGQQPITTQKGK
ncbi:MAG: hypothetical protein RR250_01975 [Akkermansia sp.]